jgi:hypothetical protein
MLALYRLLAEHSSVMSEAIEAAGLTTDPDTLNQTLVCHDDLRPPSAELVMKLASRPALKLDTTRTQKGAVYVQLGLRSDHVQAAALACPQEEGRTRGALGFLYFAETCGILCRDPPSAKDDMRSQWPGKYCLSLQHALDVLVAACYVSVAARLASPGANVGAILTAAPGSACLARMSKVFYDARAAWAEVLKQPVLDAVWAQLYEEHYQDVDKKAKVCGACDYYRVGALTRAQVKSETVRRDASTRAETVSTPRIDAASDLKAVHTDVVTPDKDKALPSAAVIDSARGLKAGLEEECASSMLETRVPRPARSRRDKARRICESESEDSLDTVSEDEAPARLRKRVRAATRARDLHDFAESECTEDCV